MEMKKKATKGLKIKQQQKTKLVQRYLIAGGIFSIFAFVSALIYWNLGVNTSAVAGVSYTWNGSSDSLWSNTDNWTPSGVPSVNDQITIPSSLSRYPVLDNAVTTSDMTLNSGSQLDMNGFSLTLAGSFVMNTTSALELRGGNLLINGNATFNGGTITTSTGTGNMVTNGSSTVFGSGSGGPTIHPDIEVNSEIVTVRNTTFNGITRLTKTGASNDVASGNNTFNDSTFITNSGTGYLIFSNSTRDIYNAPLILNSLGAGVLYMAYNGTNTQFNENLIFNSTGGGIRIGGSNGTSILAADKQLTIGNTGYTSGTLQLSRMSIGGSSDQSLTLTGSAVLTLGPATTFPSDFMAVSPGVSLNGVVFNGDVNITKIGAVNTHGSGNNTYNGTTVITNEGTGFMSFSNSTRDIFNGEVTFNSTGAGVLYVAHNGVNTQFNDHVNVNSTSTGSIRFGSAAGTSILAAGKSIRVGGAGFESGSLQLGGIAFPAGNFDLSLGNAVTLTLGPSTSFLNDVTVTSGGMCLSGCTFNGKLTAVKTGSSNDNGSGNTTYNDSVHVINNGTGYMVMSNSTRDIFNAPATFSSNGTGTIYVAHKGTNTLFNENIYLNSAGGGGGVRISTGNGTSVLADGKSILEGTSGFLDGNLMIGAVNISAASPQTITAGINATVTIGPAAMIAAPLSVEAGGVCMNGGTFGGKVSLLKTGAGNNTGNGNNVFSDSLSIVNNGTGYIVFSNSVRDIYNGTVSATSNSSGIVYLAHRGTNTEFNENIIVSSTSNGSIRFGASAGTSSLAAGKSFIVGTSGFNSGSLTLSRLTQAGADPLSFTLGSGAILILGPALVLNGDVSINSGGVCFNGATFNGATSVTKTGATNDAGSGNNVYNATSSFINSGTGYLLFANSTRDVFNDDVEFTCSGSGLIHVGYNGGVTEFNGDLILNSTGSAGIRFGGGNGSSQLADGKKILIGAGNYTGGELNLRRFTQVGNTPQSLNMSSGTAALYLSLNSTFNGAVDFSFPQVYLHGAVFNSTVRVEKNGAGSNTSNGGNIFNQRVTIKNSGTGSFVLANSNPDDFNNNASFIQTGTGVLSPASNANCTFSGDISLDSSTAAITFALSSAGYVTLDGSTTQQIKGHLLFPPVIRRLIVDKPGGDVRLNVPITVSHSLNLTSGIVYSNVANLFTVGSSVATVTNVSNTSYVEGPVRKIGNAAFTFPVGANGVYRPIGMTAPSSSTEQYTAEYFKANPDSIYPVNNRESSLYNVSRCEYWTFQRNLGSSNVRIALSWQSPVSCGISAVGDLRVARWDVLASRWNDLGNASFSGDVSTGTLQSNLPGTPFGVFALGTSSAANSLPIELISFSAEREGSTALVKWATQTEKNNDYFTIERSGDGGEFTSLGTVNGSGNTVTRKDYSFIDQSPLEGRSYYRLKQTDYNGENETFRAVLLDFGKSDKSFSMTSVGPNPFINELQVNFSSDIEGVAEFMLYNVQGTVSFRESMDISRGSNTVNLSILNDLPPGIYFLKLISGDSTTEPVKLVRK